MANEVGNSDLVTTWAFTGTKIEPDPSKFDQGWFLGERPPFEYMNWLQNDFGQKLNHLLTFGGAEWNAVTEYPPGAQVTDGGGAWLSLILNDNSQPSLANPNWASVLTSAVASGALLAVNNLSDLNDAAIARSNLGLGGVATESIVPISKGGTGAITAPLARTALGLGSVAVKDFTDDDDLSVDTGNVGTRGNMAAAIAAGSILSAGFISTAQTITSAGLLTLAHGLGVEPKFITITLECIAAEDGYSIGDRIEVNWNNTSSATSRVNTPRKDMTNIYLRLSSKSNCFSVGNGTTGAETTLTNNKWQLYVGAFA